jgi:hypothetical protein
MPYLNSRTECTQNSGENSHPKLVESLSHLPMNWKDDISPMVNWVKEFLCAILFISLLAFAMTAEDAVGQVRFNEPVINLVGCE